MATTVGNVTVQNANETTPSFSHDNDGSTLVVIINSNTNNTVSSVPTYNSVSMTLVQKITSGTRRCWMYYLDSPAGGANTLTWTMSGATNMRSQVISLIGTVSGSLGNIGSDTGSGRTGANATISTSSSSLLVGGICKSNNENITPEVGETEVDDGQIVATGNRGWFAHTDGDGGSVRLGATWSTSSDVSLNIAEFLGVSIAAPRWMIHPRGRPRVSHMVSVLEEAV